MKETARAMGAAAGGADGLRTSPAPAGAVFPPASPSAERRVERRRSGLSRRGCGGADLRRSLAMLVMATRLGSGRARAALTVIIFLAVWLLLSLPDAFAATATRASSFSYDADGLLVSETVEPNDAQLGVRTTYVHDAFGNRLSATTANLAGATGNAVIASRATSATFEANGRFALSATNALGHVESAVTDPKFGVTTSQTGPNNLTASWQYDSFGRPTLETRPDGNRTAFAYAYCSGVAGGTASCPTHGAYVMTATPQNAAGTQNGPLVKTYHDTHGRTIATDTQSFAAATIRQSTEYDALGRTYRESRPYFLSGGTPKWTTYAYDALGRTTAITLPDGSATSFGYDGLTTTVTNDLGQTETTVKNARGEIASVTDANGKTTSFTYDPFGNRTSITDSMGNVQTMTYDKAGRKIAGVDPDLGSWTYAYNVLGELVSQTDAKGQTTTMTYDKLGRPLTRAAPGHTSTWVYDTATTGIGKLATSSTSDGYLKTLGYDSLGRPVTTAIRSETGQPTYTTTTTWTADSRINTVNYPSGFRVKYAYTALGYLADMRDFASNALLWQANAVDAEGRVTQETAGNGVVTNRTFDANRGFITSVTAGPSNSVANLAFAFDTIGNLTQRKDLTQGATGLTETFTYDVLNRLKTYNTTGSATVSKSVAYNAIGNITAKSDVGLYVYAAAGTPRPHAVVGAGGVDYAYDANGNLLSGGGRTATWTSFNTVAAMTRGTTSLSWGYDAEHQRSKQVSTVGTTTSTTWYYDDAASGVFFERVVGPSAATWNEYLFAGGEMIGVHFTAATAPAEPFLYFVKDHLGSIAVIVNGAGVVHERLAYDAWGKRRHPNGTDDAANILTASATRGFTGHEMIDEMDLVNMNGRVYDPALGRFLSADPFIHDVTNAQDLNRYSYVHNNPLSYTDMNGYGFFKSLGKFFKKILKPLIALAVALTLQFELLPALLPGLAGAEAGGFALGKAVIAGLSGGVGNVILSGRPKAFLSGFGQAFATFGVGHGLFKGGAAFGSAKWAGKAVAHGVVGGAFAEIRGGSFRSGFLAAGFSSAVAPLAPSGDAWRAAAFHAAAGGVGSVLGGGKFADGAATGAFAYLFNDAVQSASEKNRPVSVRILGYTEVNGGRLYTYEVLNADGDVISRCQCQVRENIEVIDQTGTSMNTRANPDFVEIPYSTFKDTIGPTGQVISPEINGSITVRQSFTFRYAGDTYAATTVFEHRITITNGDVSVEFTVIDD
jgi:RHS repeat-associated protein